MTNSTGRDCTHDKDVYVTSAGAAQNDNRVPRPGDGTVEDNGHEIELTTGLVSLERRCRYLLQAWDALMEADAAHRAERPAPRGGDDTTKLERWVEDSIRLAKAGSILSDRLTRVLQQAQATHAALQDAKRRKRAA